MTIRITVSTDMTKSKSGGEAIDPTTRFTELADNYHLYRPTYPEGLLEFMEKELGLTPSSVVSNIGSGTGILTRLFLENGNRVHAIEPNTPMREIAEKTLKYFPGFTSHASKAEATGLPAGSVDFVLAGQAFHWFDLEPARREFARILRHQGWVALIWNIRHKNTSPFLSAYEELLCRLGLGYPVTKSDKEPGGLSRGLFPVGQEHRIVLPHIQDLTLEAFRGRLLSCSYAPLPGHPNHDPMMRELDALFSAHQNSGLVRITYDTEVHYGRLIAT